MDKQVQFTTVKNWAATGGSLDMNLSSMRPNAEIHQNALLRRDEWARLDAAVLDTLKTGLTVFNDVRSAGLVENLGGLGTLLSGYEKVGEFTEANVSMDGDVPGEEDAVEYTDEFVPIPIIYKDFRISKRKLEASRKMGQPLDTTQIRAATRVVREKIEAMVVNGESTQLAGYPIYGLTNHPNRLTGTAVGDFGTATNGYKTMVKALGALGAIGANGPFNVYVAQTQFNELLNLISTSYERNEFEVISDGLSQISAVKPSFDLAAGSLVFVSMDKQTIDLAIGEDIKVVQWDEMGGMITRFRVMAALAPRVKADANSNIALLHYTGA